MYISNIDNTCCVLLEKISIVADYSDIDKHQCKEIRKCVMFDVYNSYGTDEQAMKIAELAVNEYLSIASKEYHIIINDNLDYGTYPKSTCDFIYQHVLSALDQSYKVFHMSNLNL